MIVGDVRVAIVSGPRSDEAMGMELAELRLLEAVRAAATGVRIDVRVIGGRSARRHSRRLHGSWVPARPGQLPSVAVARAGLIHLLGLDLPPPRRKPFIAMVHDLAPLNYDDEGELPSWTGELVARAGLLLAPSAFTAAELGRHFAVQDERVRVIGSGPALVARDVEPLSPSDLRGYGIESPFILRYGGYTTRKNVPLLLKAWAEVPVGTLVLAGPPQKAREKILSEATSLDRVVVLDYVPEALLARLLRSAAALASTSSYEGFGLPLLEAMAAGTAVVAVSTPFVREVCGDAALLVAEEHEALAAALRRLLADEALAASLRAAGTRRGACFTWSKTAFATLEAYETILRGT
jgi:glycosyltransferase involved in cell wall biosynthesis